MKFINRETVVTYKYDNEREMEIHSKSMVRDGWTVGVGNTHSIFKNNLIRKYTKSIPEGAFL